MHDKPNAAEIAACRPWLEAELEAVKPKMIVCLGATAAQAILGKQFRVSREHGKFVSSDLAEHVTATFHPAAVLRAPDEETRKQITNQLIADLKKCAFALSSR